MCVLAELDFLLSSDIKQTALIIGTDLQIMVRGSLAPVHGYTNRVPEMKAGKFLMEFKERSVRTT